MKVLRTIPAVPAVAQIVDSVFTVSSMNINFIEKTVTFAVASNYISPPMVGYVAQAPASRVVSFDEIAPLLTAPDVSGFILTVRNALALSMGVTLAKVPADIFAP